MRVEIVVRYTYRRTGTRYGHLLLLFCANYGPTPVQLVGSLDAVLVRICVLFQDGEELDEEEKKRYEEERVSHWHINVLYVACHAAVLFEFLPRNFYSN